LPSIRATARFLLDQDQRRHGPHLELLRELGLRLHVDVRHAQPMPLLARELREEAFHPAGGTRPPG